MLQATTKKTRKTETTEKIKRRRKMADDWVENGQARKNIAVSKDLDQKNRDHLKRFSTPELPRRKKRKKEFAAYLGNQVPHCLVNEKFVGTPTEDVAYSLFVLSEVRIAQNENGEYLLFQKIR